MTQWLKKMFGLRIFKDSLSLEGYKFKFSSRVLLVSLSPSLTVTFQPWLTYFSPTLYIQWGSHMNFHTPFFLMLFLMLEMSFQFFFDDKFYIQFQDWSQMPVPLWGLFLLHQVVCQSFCYELRALCMCVYHCT